MKNQVFFLTLFFGMNGSLIANPFQETKWNKWEAQLLHDPSYSYLNFSSTSEQGFFKETKTSPSKKIESLKEYKEKMRTQLAVKFNNHFQIGVNKLKISPEMRNSQIIALEPQLQPKGSKGSAKGYGVEFRMKL